MNKRIKGKCPYCGAVRWISEKRLLIPRKIKCMQCDMHSGPKEFLARKKKVNTGVGTINLNGSTPFMEH